MKSKNPLIGKTLAKCKIIAPLGHGVTSSIFRAHYAPLGKEVAVKVLKEDMKARPQIREKFVNEAKALARLDHENIVKVFDVVEEKGFLLIIMEFLEGRNVLEALDADGPFPAEHAVEITAQVARALASAHEAGIVHRDVKPQNIMLVGRRERVKLVDFGLATRGATHGKAGTPSYMSPEQIQGKRVDEHSDVYALGATFFHMLTGRPPYTGRNPKEVMEKHLKGELPTVSRANRNVDVPKALDPVVKRMMAPVPGYRYSAKDLAQALDHIKLSPGARHHRGASRSGHPRGTGRAARTGRGGRGTPARSKQTPLYIALGVVGVVAVVLVALLLSRGNHGSTHSTGKSANVTRSNAGANSGAAPVVPSASQPTPDQKAEQDYQLAMAYEANHADDFAKVISHYEAVVKKYGAKSKWGQKAEGRAENVRERQAAAQEAAAEAKRQQQKKKARKALDTELATLVAKYRFAKARKAVETFILSYGQEKDLALHYNRLKFAAELLDSLSRNLALDEKKHKLNLFKPEAPADAYLAEATPDGIEIEEGGIKERHPWSYFSPEEIGKLVRYELGRQDPRNFCLLYAFYMEVGKDKAAKSALETAKLFDQMGQVDHFLQQLKAM